MAIANSCNSRLQITTILYSHKAFLSPSVQKSKTLLTKPMLSVLLLAHLQILWTLLTYLRLLHSHHSLKFWTILAYVEHCHRLSSTDTTWLLQSVLHIMSSFIFTKCVSIISVHRPQTFQELLNALTQIKMQSFYLPSVSHPLLCHSPALSWF